MNFTIRFSTKESLEYGEGDVTYEFWIGGVIDVPRSEDWDRVLPEEFCGRREEIVGRIKSQRGLNGIPIRDIFA